MGDTTTLTFTFHDLMFGEEYYADFDYYGEWYFPRKSLTGTGVHRIIKPVTVISLDRTSAAITVGDQLQLAATTLPYDIGTNNIVWTTDRDDVATVDADGLVSAIGPGTAVITATAGDGSGKSATCRVDVAGLQPTSLTLNMTDAVVRAGESFRLMPAFEPEIATFTHLRWTSSNAAVAAVDQNGEVTGLAEGRTVITAATTQGSNLAASCLVTVEAADRTGDVNGDGLVDVDDLNLVVNMIVRLQHSSGYSYVSDLNNDGIIDIDDANMIINIMLGKSKQVTTFYVAGAKFEMVPVDGGTFTMGATPEQGSDARDTEKPAHQVTLSDFMVGRTEVTQALWRAVMGNNPSTFVGDDLPVECVSWNDCQEFIARLKALTGLHFRLPTEAEWEFAARGGNRGRGTKFAGSNDLNEVAWWRDNSDGHTHPVATKMPNELGLYDMSGNVYELVADSKENYTADAVIDPICISYGNKVSRGGGWIRDSIGQRVSFRGSASSSDADYVMGFRLALDNRVTIYKVGDVNFEMMPVDGGTFTMGATPEQGDDARDTEKPAHQVTLSDYAIGVTEVTQDLWKAVMGDNPSSNVGDNLPVECVSWNDCQEFIAKLNALTGEDFRLPTEAEWEYAARGGKRSRGYKYAGSDYIYSVAWWSGNSDGHSHPVATKFPNELGLYDMSGNVYELVADWWGNYSADAVSNPTGPASGTKKISRGGGWNRDQIGQRVSFRGNATTNSADYVMGFRLAK